MGKRTLTNPIRFNPIEFNEDCKYYYYQNNIKACGTLLMNIVNYIEYKCGIQVDSIDLFITDNCDSLREMCSEVWPKYDNGEIIGNFYSLGISGYNYLVMSNDLISVQKELDLYLNSLGIYNNRLAVWVFIVLHELGHTMYYEFYKDNMSLFASLNEAISEINRAFLTSGVYKEKVPQEFYNNSQSELFADNFALKHFPSVWNHLKQEGLI